MWVKTQTDKIISVQSFAYRPAAQNNFYDIVGYTDSASINEVILCTYTLPQVMAILTELAEALNTNAGCFSFPRSEKELKVRTRVVTECGSVAENVSDMTVFEVKNEDGTSTFELRAFLAGKSEIVNYYTNDWKNYALVGVYSEQNKAQAVADRWKRRAADNPRAAFGVSASIF